MTFSSGTDLALLQTLQTWTQSPMLFALSIFAAKELIFVLALMVGVLGFGKRREHDRPFAYAAAWSSMLAFIVSLAIGALVRRPRPFVLPTIVSRIHAPLTEFSFPSSHSAVAFAIAASLTLARPGLGAIALLLAAFVAAGRVAVGVHYPSDVLVGAILGILSALLVHWYRLYLLPKYLRKNKV